MPSRILYQVPHPFTPMVPGDFMVPIAKAALEGVGAGTVGGQKQQCKAGMLPQPVPDGSGLMDFVVVGDHLAPFKTMGRVYTIEDVQKIHKLSCTLPKPHA